MTKMSKEAAAALINARPNQGAEVKGTPRALAELSSAGLVGPEHGLTRKGTIERERALNAALDSAF